MGLVSGIWLAVLGVLGAANLIIARRPDAKQYIDKLAPYQGWIGAVSALWGIWAVISMVLFNIGWLTLVPILWISLTASAAVQLLLGFLLGFGVLKTFIKAPEAQARMDQTLAKLAPYQGTLGLISIGLGVWAVISTFMWHI